MRRLVVVGTAMLIVIAAYAGPAVASAPDRPNLTSLTVSAAHPQVGDTVTVDAKAFDHGGVEYFVYFFTPRLTALTCVGTPSGPSPDTPSCEYNAATTTTRFMTHTILSFEPAAPLPYRRSNGAGLPSSRVRRPSGIVPPVQSPT